MKDAKSEVVKVVAENTGINPELVRGSEDLWTLGLTSLAAVRILVELEDEFAVIIDDESLTRDTFRSVQTLVEVLQVALLARTVTLG